VEGGVWDDGRDVSDETLAALAALTPEHRAVIVLRHLLGYSPGEIAELLDLPRGTVNSRLRRGLDTLKETVLRET
jgi:RNA polymerase sigma-70 factor (ECF subfamily)